MKPTRVQTKEPTTAPRITDWPAKRAFLRAVYDATSDRGLVFSVIDHWVDKHDKAEFGEKCYQTFKRWGPSRPTGPDSVNFWNWIIQNHALQAKPLQLWTCTITEFIDLFPPAEADVHLAVTQLLCDEDAKLDATTKANLRKRFAFGSVPALAPGDIGVPEYTIGCSESLSFEGPQTGLRSGRIQHNQFYTVPEAATAWTALVDTENYRMYTDCLLSLTNLVASTSWLRAIEDGRHHALVTLGGGGSPEKDWVIVKCLLRAVRQLDLVLTDISLYMLSLSARVLCQRFRKDGLTQKVHASYKLCDFLRLDELFRRRDSWQSVVWTLLGGSIGNVPAERDFFRALRGPSKIGDLLVMGIDTTGSSSDVDLSVRMNAVYRSREVDAFLLATIPGSMKVAGKDTVKVSVAGNSRGNPYSDVPNARTAVFSIPLLHDGSERETILTTSTRYVAEDFLAYAGRFGWQHIVTAQAGEDSTFRQLLLRRVT